MENKAILPFEKGDGTATDADPYFSPRPDTSLMEVDASQDSDVAIFPPQDGVLPLTNENKEVIDPALLLFHVNPLTGVCRLCIHPSVVKDIIGIAHGRGHPGYARCYEIISRS